MVQACIREALADQQPLELIGGGTKRRVGRPVEAAAVLDLSGLRGIRTYDPAELVLTAATGTPLAEVEAAVAERGQHLVFEPADLREALGSSGEPTLGGMIAANLSGPRRVQAGAVRDHLLGFSGVTGRGEIVKSGGTVVKNVTGYDLSKLVSGSWGTLMALIEVSLRVLPRPAASMTLRYEGLDVQAAGRLMSAALGSHFEVSGAAWLPGQPSRTLLRLEGAAATLPACVAALSAFLSRYPRPETVEDSAHAAIWKQIGDASVLQDPPESTLWRISVPAAAGPALVASLPAGDAYLDWGGGLVWARLAAIPDGGAAFLRQRIVETGGHATLIRGDEALRRAVDVFQPLPSPLAALSLRVKQAFDPHHILNPGRLFAGH